MAVHLAFNEHLDSPLVTSAPTNLAVATTRLRSHVRAGFYFPVISVSATAQTAAAITEGWISFYYGGVTTGNSSGQNIFAPRNAGGTASLFTLQHNGNDLGIKLINPNDSSNTTLTAVGYGLNYKFDFNFKINATTGFIYVYRDGVLIYSYTGNTTASSTLASVGQLWFGSTDLGATDINSQTIFSEVLVSDESTIGSKVITRPFTAFGDVNQWTGAIADINTSSSPDTTYMSETTNGEILTLASASIPTLGAGETVSAVFLNYRANYEPSSPVTKIAPLVRKSGTNYVGTPVSLINTVAAYQYKWEVDPATSAAWTEAGVNAIQLGFRADT